MHLRLHRRDADYIIGVEEMKAITLRNIPPELARQIRRKATEKGTSLNKIVLRLLEESLGLKGKKKERPVYDDLDDLAGSCMSG